MPSEVKIEAVGLCVSRQRRLREIRCSNNNHVCFYWIYLHLRKSRDSNALGGQGREQSPRAAETPFLGVLLDFGFGRLKGREWWLLLSYTFFKEFPLGWLVQWFCQRLWKPKTKAAVGFLVSFQEGWPSHQERSRITVQQFPHQPPSDEISKVWRKS